LDDEVGDQGDGLWVVEPDAALKPATGDHGRHRDEQPILLTRRQVHRNPKDRDPGERTPYRWRPSRTAIMTRCGPLRQLARSWAPALCQIRRPVISRTRWAGWASRPPREAEAGKRATDAPDRCILPSARGHGGACRD